jgi:proteasome lid subunit RPN8/RPN11
VRAIDAHAIKCYPIECYGLILGKIGKDGIEAKEVVEGKDLSSSPVSFEADPAFVYKEYKKAEERGLEFVGIYHSHPNLHAFVSSRDADHMKYWGHIAWLILGLSKDRVLERKAFTMKKGGIEELELVVS